TAEERGVASDRGGAGEPDLKREISGESAEIGTRDIDAGGAGAAAGRDRQTRAGQGSRGRFDGGGGAGVANGGDSASPCHGAVAGEVEVVLEDRGGVDAGSQRHGGKDSPGGRTDEESRWVHDVFGSRRPAP